MKQIIRGNSDILILAILLASIGLGVIFKYNFAFYVVMFLSTFGFISIIFPPVSTSEPDERDLFVNGKASAISFVTTVIIVSYASITLDSIQLFKELQPKTLMQMLLVFLYTFYLIVYAVLKRRY